MRVASKPLWTQNEQGLHSVNVSKREEIGDFALEKMYSKMLIKSSKLKRLSKGEKIDDQNRADFKYSV